MIEKLLPKRMRPEDQRFLALAVSAFVCPGAGQCMAGRWVIGVAFALGFTMSFCAAVILLLWPPLLQARAWMETYLSGFTDTPQAAFQWPWIGASFLSTCLLYVWNILDAWWQVRRDLAP